MNELRLLKLLNEGSCCFLVKYKNESEKVLLYNYLSIKKYTWIRHSSSLATTPTVYINTLTKICRTGILGVAVVPKTIRPICISVDDFFKIMKIFSKYDVNY